MTQRTSTDLAVMTGKSGSLKTLKNGTLRLAIDLEEDYHNTATQFFNTSGTLVAVARLNPEIKKPRSLAKKLYEKEADILLQSDFFRSPKVWRAVGSHLEFLHWLRQQPCAYCEKHATKQNLNEISYVGANGVLQPEYSAIPLCHDHLLLRKARGSSALGHRRWFITTRLAHIQEFAAQILLKQLGQHDWSNVKPIELKKWAISKQVASMLPSVYGLAE